MLTDTETLQVVLDVCGVFVFALSGALVAVRRGLDLFGVMVLAWVAGLGGGIMRDVLLGLTPPVALRDWRLVAAALLAGTVVFVFYGNWARVSERYPDARPRRLATRAVRVLDAVGLGLFAVSGALVALHVDAGPLAATLVGGVTAVGGGLLRDLLARQVPEVLQRELYALPALAGAALVVLLDRLGWLSTSTVWLAVALVVGIRVTAVALDLNAPRALRTGD